MSGSTSHVNMARISRTLAVLGAGLLFAACANQSYMGIPLLPGKAPADVQELARKAQSGDKHAQLDLGIRYEEAKGLARNIVKARQLYELAARPTKNVIFIYIPPVRKGDPGAVLPVGSEFKQQGLADAHARLSRLKDAN